MRRFDVEEMINERAHALARRGSGGEAGARTYKKHLERTMQAHNHLNIVASIIQRSYRCHAARGAMDRVRAGEMSRSAAWQRHEQTPTRPPHLAPGSRAPQTNPCNSIKMNQMHFAAAISIHVAGRPRMKAVNALLLLNS